MQQKKRGSNPTEDREPAACSRNFNLLVLRSDKCSYEDKCSFTAGGARERRVTFVDLSKRS